MVYPPKIIWRASITKVRNIDFFFKNAKIFEEEDEQAAAEGEDLCHLSAYNRRLRATQSPNFSTVVN